MMKKMKDKKTNKEEDEEEEEVEEDKWRRMDQYTKCTFMSRSLMQFTCCPTGVYIAKCCRNRDVLNAMYWTMFPEANRKCI